VPRNVVVDAGPIVAWLRANDPLHDWAAEQIGRLRPPLISCEAVLSEAAHLVRRGGGDPASVLMLVAKDVVRVGISVQEQAAQLHSLMDRYGNVPMSLADACLVRLSELLDDAAIMTFDSDFRIYRRSGRALIPLMAPDGV
jgi:predicted nucleic acid-binding protein